MSETRRDREMAKEQAAKIAQRRLLFWIAFLIISIVTLVFRIGEALWPLWLIDYRLRIVALLLLITIGTILLSPLIIEHSKNPRALSGPGKNPYIDP
ncbi:MAG TPA: hypothetical protein VJM08_06110 [Anaerolineales bacterium]|nr:hypothetical protein [Anaerolineales bacterium]